MRRLLRIAVLTPTLALAFLVTEALSVVVAPTAVYMDHRTRSATLTLFNPSSEAEEVTIRAVFGYPTTDEDGTLRLLTEEGSEDPRSAAGWLRAFPQRLVLEPGQRQVVRLLGEPPADLPDGEYWARLVVTSRGRSLPVNASAEGQVRVGLDLEIRTIIAASYRKGEVSTSLDVEGFTPEIREGRLELRPHLVRNGTAAYIGLMRLGLEDGSGREVGSWTEQVAVYREYQRRFSYDVGELRPGVYTVRAVFTTERDDIPSAHRLRTRPLELAAEVVVP